jgi:poly-gamma-glutamate capsule biosynthesis protein CapA/YwtB (metallophosphatase superfamily)
MVDDVRQAAKKCDAVVVSVHWGDEFIDVPAPEEVEYPFEIDFGKVIEFYTR